MGLLKAKEVIVGLAEGKLLTEKERVLGREHDGLAKSKEFIVGFMATFLILASSLSCTISLLL